MDQLVEVVLLIRGSGAAPASHLDSSLPAGQDRGLAWTSEPASGLRGEKSLEARPRMKRTLASSGGMLEPRHSDSLGGKM